MKSLGAFLFLLTASIHAAAGNDISLPNLSMNFSELEEHCKSELTNTLYSYPALGEAKVLEWRLLAWYRGRHLKSEFYVDSALSWANIDTKAGKRWVLLQNYRNNNSTHWATSYILDSKDNTWSVYFEKPPKNRDVYGKMTRFEWNPGADWRIYKDNILTENWTSVIGEKPTKSFAAKIRGEIEQGSRAEDQVGVNPN